MFQFPEEPLCARTSDGFGYFPAYPGLKLSQNRYEIVRKLGFGPRSSVWLAVDAEDDRYLALKILTAHATGQKTSELDVLQEMRRAGSPHNLPHLRGRFTAHSPHGAHLCLALLVMGPSLEDLRLFAPAGALPVHVVQTAIAAVMEPLMALHGRCIIHGAVTGANISLAIYQAKEDLEPMLARLPPCTVEKQVVDGVEYPVVRGQPIPHGFVWDDTRDVIANSIFDLNNLGHAQRINAWVAAPPTWERARMDRSLRPPEVILETAYNQAVDIWMLGCATYHLLTGAPLFPPGLADDEGVQLAWAQAMAGGRITSEVARSSPVRARFFDEDAFARDIPEDTLESRLAASVMYRSTPAQIRGAVDFIEKCLTLDVVERPTAGQLLRHPWLTPGCACSCGTCG